MEAGPKKRLLIGCSLVLFWVFVGSFGYVILEGWSFIDALYMTVITLSTVGFKEVRPIGPASQVFTMVLIVSGMVTVTVTLSGLAQIMLELQLANVLGNKKMKQELEKLRNHFIVCGYGKIGRLVVQGLDREGAKFCVIEQDPGLAEDFRETGIIFITGDATEESVLQHAGIERARGIIGLLPTDADNLYLCVTAREMKRNLKIIVRASEEKAERRLRRGGADIVLSTSMVMGGRLVQAAVNPTAMEFMDLLTHLEELAPLDLGENYVGPGSPFCGKSIREADIRARFGVIVVAVKRAGQEMIFNPDASEILNDGDILVLLGKKEDLQKLRENSAPRNGVAG
jgi:voltage-gated potassium channel